MKLVDILARELKKWPLVSAGCESITQDGDGDLNSTDHGAKPELDARGRAWSGAYSSFLEDGKGETIRMEVAEDWDTAIVTREQWQAAVEALKVPAAAAWNGEGLPPAETVVELRTVSAKTDWAKAKIKFASRNVVVWDWDGEPSVNGLCTAYAHAIEMRPIRTPEQIAAEEREAAIKEMADIYRNAPGVGLESGIAAIYDANYRKQVAP